MHLERATWTETDMIDTNLAVLPIGSTEQHGPHAPLGTDTLNAETIADAAADRYEGTVIVAPAIPVGIAEEHRQFTGTLWTSEPTFKSYVRDVVESLASHGWNRIVLVNGHGGNTSALRDVAGQIVRDGGAYAVPFTWFDEVGKYSPQMGHGGPLETALLQYSVPETVREEHLDEAAENGSDRWGDWQGRVNLAFDSADFTENGVVGDPREGSPALGEELHDIAANALVELLETVADRSLEAADYR